MAVINTEPIKQRVYTKIQDGSLSPVSYWAISDSIEMPDGSTLTDYLQKMGDGATIYLVNQDDTSDLDTAIASLGITEFNKGQMLVIADDNDNTAGYVFNGDKWIAFSGNVSADNVIFSKDIICAGNYTQVGNITKKQTEAIPISTAGKSLQFVMDKIFTQELQPNVTNPSVGITLTNAGSYEVGTEITPNYSVSFNAGSYTYGPATGVTFSNLVVTDTDGNTKNDNSGTFDAFTISDTTNYKVSATADHTGGAVAQSNVGNPSNPIKQIAAGTKSSSPSSAITGYRSFFYGVVDNTNPITSALIRGLTNSNKAYKSSETFTIYANKYNDPKRIIIAYPANCGRVGIKDNDSVIMPSAMNAAVGDSYKKQADTVNVEGVNGFDTIPYTVWVYQPAKLDPTEIHKITLA